MHETKDNPVCFQAIPDELLVKEMPQGCSQNAINLLLDTKE